jgi:hypothetical protein
MNHSNQEAQRIREIQGDERGTEIEEGVLLEM